MQGVLLKLQAKKLATLQRKSTCECKRMAAETPEKREARLQWMSTNQHKRLAVEPLKREKQDYSR